MEPSLASLAALIGAYEPGPAEGGLRALAEMAGATILEHQARRAAGLGAAPVLLLVDDVPQALVDAVARLRRDAIDVVLVDGIDQAIEGVPPDRPILLIADACLPHAQTLRDMGGAEAPLLATLEDVPATAAFERIDAATRWAGTALLDRAHLMEAAAIVGSWDPVSTLLRRAVQEGARRLPADATPPLLLTTPEEALAAERLMLRQTRRRPHDWVERWLVMPAIEATLPWLIGRRVEAWHAALAAVVLTLLGCLAAVTGWLRPALLVLVLGDAARAVAQRLADLDARPIPFSRVLANVIPGAAVVALIGICRVLAERSGQWGWWLVGGATVAATAALVRQRAMADTPLPLWVARRRGLLWALVPFGVVGRWNAGAAILLVYACVSFAFVQRQTTLPSAKLF